MLVPVEKNQYFLIVTRPGFEPGQLESESNVLPLYDRAIDKQI